VKYTKPGQINPWTAQRPGIVGVFSRSHEKEGCTLERKVAFPDKERGPRETPCPRCGGEARMRFLDEAKSEVEVQCPDCGTFQMPRPDFDQAVADLTETESDPNEPE